MLNTRQPPLPKRAESSASQPGRRWPNRNEGDGLKKRPGDVRTPKSQPTPCLHVDDVTATLEKIITQLQKEELSDPEWELIADLVHTLHGSGQLFIPAVPSEPVTYMQKLSRWRMDFSSERKKLAGELQKRNREAGLDNAKRALILW